MEARRSWKTVGVAMGGMKLEDETEGNICSTTCLYYFFTFIVVLFWEL